MAEPQQQMLIIQSADHITIPRSEVPVILSSRGYLDSQLCVNFLRCGVPAVQVLLSEPNVLNARRDLEDLRSCLVRLQRPGEKCTAHMGDEKPFVIIVTRQIEPVRNQPK